jgi:hypothetical protein
MTTDAVGGVWTYSIDLARGLGARGVHVVLAAMGPAPSPAQREAAAAAGARLEHAPLDLEWMDDPWEDLAEAGDWLLELEARHACDIVHLNGYAHARRAFPARRSSSRTRACCPGGMPSSASRLRALGALRRGRERGLAAAAHVVTPTRWMRDSLERHYGALPTPTSVIYNTRAPGIYHPGEKQPYILGAGRVWDEAKNLGSLGRASRALSWPVRDRGPRGIAARDGRARPRQ